MPESTIAYIGLGSNLGDRQRAIDSAVRALGRSSGIDVVAVSDVIETAPLGPAGQSSYLNAVAKIATERDADDLLEALKAIENMLGRVRRERWGPRSIDLDLLLYGQENLRLPDLIVPHPQLHLRSFVLRGLCQLDPELMHPLLKVSVTELAGRLGGQDFALDPEAPALVSVAGLIGVGKTTLVNRLAQTLQADTLLEPYDTNPFLPEVYAGRRDLGLDCQLYFLLGRAAQLAPEALAAGKVSLTDYVFEKELIYARRLLDAEQLKLYEQIYEAFAEKVAAPLLVIYLQDTPAHCLERIHSRNRPYEQEIGQDFLDMLHGDYEKLFSTWSACPVVRLPAGNVGLDDEAAIKHLALQVDAYIAAGETAATK